MYVTPPGSDAAEDSSSATTLSPDEREGLDTEQDEGLIRVLEQIRNLSNANVGELKSYKTPPVEVHGVSFLQILNRKDFV